LGIQAFFISSFIPLILPLSAVVAASTNRLTRQSSTSWLLVLIASLQQQNWHESTKSMPPPFGTYAGLLSFVVILSVRAVGVLLVTAMLIVPAGAARNFARTAGGMVW
jgi:hypothetical protein